MHHITLDRLADITLGVTLLGNGGGGSPHQSSMVTHELIARNGPVRMLDVREVDDDACVVALAVLGTPTAINEKIPSAPQFVNALTALERHLGVAATAVIPLAIGGMSAFTPLFVASTLSLPCINADGARQAVSQIEMSTFSLAGISASPMAVADDRGNHVIINTADNYIGERLARMATMELGLTTALAAYPMTGRQVRETAIADSYSYAEHLGITLRSVQEGTLTWQEWCEIVDGELLVSGKIIELTRKTTPGFAKSSAVIESIDGSTTLRLEMQNELLVAIINGEVARTTPDLLCITHFETATPASIDMLAVGDLVRVLALPCAAEWRVSGMDEVMGPQVYGYRVPNTVHALPGSSC